MAEEVGNLKVKVSMDGTGFQNGVSSINRQLKVVKSEFKVASAEVDEFGSVTDKLKVKADSLTKQINLQKQKVSLYTKQLEKSKTALKDNTQKMADLKTKVESARDAWEHSKKTVGENDEATKKLKKAYTDLTKEYKNIDSVVKTNARTIDNYKIRTNSAKTVMAKMEKELKKTNKEIALQSSNWTKLSSKLQTVSSKMTSIGSALKGTGKTISTAITLPLLGVGSASSKVANDIDSVQGKIQASIGTTEEEAKKLTQIASDMWENAFVESVDEASQAVILIKQQLKDIPDESIQPIAEAAFTLQDLFGYGLTESIRSSKALIDNFGVDGAEAFDYITVAAQKGGDFSKELLDTISEYSTQFSSAGFSIDGMFNVLIQGAQNGAWNLDKVGDAVKEFNIRTKEGSNDTVEGFELIGFSSEEMANKIASGGEEGEKAFMATIAALSAMEDPIRRNTAGVALFGTQWEDLEANVMTSLDPTIDAIGNVEDATQKAGDVLYDNFGTRIKSYFREIQTSLKPIGNTILETLEQILPLLKSLSSNFSNLSPEMQKALIIISAIVGAVGPLLIILGTLISSVGTITGAFSAASLAIGEAGGLLAVITGPIGITIAAVVGLAAVAFLIIKNWGNIKGFFINLWKTVSDAFINTWINIKTSVSSIISSFISYITITFNDQLNLISSILFNLYNIFKQQWEIIKNVVLGIILIFIDLITLDFVNLRKDLINILANLKNSFSSIWESIKNIVLDFALLLLNSLLQTFQAIKEGIYKKVTSIKKIIVNGINEAVEYIKSLPDKAYEWGSDFIQGLINGIKSKIGKVKDAVSSVANKIRSVLHFSVPDEGPLTDYEKWMPDFMDGLAKGIQSSKHRVTNAIKSLATDMSIKTRLTPGLIGGSSRNITIINQGTIVGSNGMDEFADIMSRKIAGKYGSITGGDW